MGDSAMTDVGAARAPASARNTSHGTAKYIEEDDNDGLPVTHEVHIPAYEKSILTAFALDRAGSRMVTGSMAGQFKYYDFIGMNETKQHFRLMEPLGQCRVEALSFCPSGGTVLCLSADAQARIYDRDGSSRTAECRLKRADPHLIQSTIKGDMYVRMLEDTKGHTQAITDGMFHPYSNELFITSSLDGTVRIWDLNGQTGGMSQDLIQNHVLKTIDKRGLLPKVWPENLQVCGLSHWTEEVQRYAWRRDKCIAHKGPCTAEADAFYWERCGKGPRES